MSYMGRTTICAVRKSSPNQRQVMP
jgi:hypothetical protein